MLQLGERHEAPALLLGAACITESPLRAQASVQTSSATSLAFDRK
jgi:hypothetical protein